MDINESVHEQNDPAIAEELAASKLAMLFQAADIAIPVSYPIETSEVIRLFESLDYRIDGDFVLGLCEAKTLLVPMENGRRRWDALSVWALFYQLEGRRRWKPTNRHLHKMSALERMQLIAEQEGEQGIGDLDDYDIETLVLLMEESEARDVRHVFRIAIMAKLREGGVL